MKFFARAALAACLLFAANLPASRTASADTYCVTEVDFFVLYRQVRCAGGARDGRIQQISYKTTILFWTWSD